MYHLQHNTQASTESVVFTSVSYFDAVFFPTTTMSFMLQNIASNLLKTTRCQQSSPHPLQQEISSYICLCQHVMLAWIQYFRPLTLGAIQLENAKCIL